MNLPSFKKLTLKQKMILFPISWILFVFLIINFIALPAIKDIKNLKTEIIDQKVDLEKKIVKERNMNKVSAKIEEIEPQIEKFEKIFVNQNRELEFITVIEDIAEKNGLSQKINLLTASAKQSHAYKTIPLNIDVGGNFTNFVKYLIDLESLNYYINVKNIQIDSLQQSRFSNLGPNGGQNGNINIKIVADTYWQ